MTKYLFGESKFFILPHSSASFYPNDFFFVKTIFTQKSLQMAPLSFALDFLRRIRLSFTKVFIDGLNFSQPFHFIISNLISPTAPVWVDLQKRPRVQLSRSVRRRKITPPVFLLWPQLLVTLLPKLLSARYLIACPLNVVFVPYFCL